MDEDRLPSLRMLCRDRSPVGVYVHVPFCLARCSYCGFVSNVFRKEHEEPLVTGLKQEIALWTGACGPGLTADTVYMGGGTPSILKPSSIRSLLDACRRGFGVTPDAEASMEINPATADRAALEELYDAGINRISIGFQSAHDVELRAMDRAHSTRDGVEAFRSARQAGFGNISVDLMVGFPGQTKESVSHSLETVLDLDPEHISIYMLEIKPGTVLAGQIDRGTVQQPDDDFMADMYEMLVEEAASAGYGQYEIANFSKPGFSCRHNLKYWQDDVFLGIGPAAHGMTGLMRYANLESLSDYLAAVAAGRFPFATATRLTAEARFRDAMIMGLRLTRGVDLSALGVKFDLDALQFVRETTSDLAQAGLYTLDSGRMSLTGRGRLLSNILFERWV